MDLGIPVVLRTGDEMNKVTQQAGKKLTESFDVIYRFSLLQLSNLFWLIEDGWLLAI